MFEEYLQDSFDFFQRGEDSEKEREARKYFRASVFYSYSSLEAYINFICDVLEKGQNLKKFELAYLKDEVFVYDPKKLEVKKRTEYHPTEEKLKILLKRYCPRYDFKSEYWSWINDFKYFRDDLVHPKDDEDEFEIEIYRKKIKNGLTGIIYTINQLSLGIFKRPLRKRILDLTP